MIKKLDKVNLLELNEAYQKVLFLFFSFPNTSFTLNELSKKLNISKTTSNKIFNRLYKERLLKVESFGRSWRIVLNKDYAVHYSIKIGYNLMMIYKMLYESNLIEEINKKIPNYASLILFGSYRKGDDDENSDIDLAVDIGWNVINNGENKEFEIYELGLIPQFGYRKNVPVNLHIFSRNKIDLNLFSNIANGIVLVGFLETKP